MPTKTAWNSAWATRVAVGIAAWAAAAVAAEGRLLWSTPSHRHSTSVEGGPPPEPVVADGIVAWTVGGAIHAVRRDDGAPLVRASRESTVVTSLSSLFAAADAPSEARLSRPCLHAGRLFATVVAEAREGGRAGRIVAIDCSPAGGGRVEWYSGPPAGSVAFEGPPWIDGERLLSIVVGDGPRAPRRLAAFDLFDGRLLETRPATTHDRPPESAGPRVAAGGGHVVVATDRTIECRVEEEARR